MFATARKTVFLAAVVALAAVSRPALATPCCNAGDVATIRTLFDLARVGAPPPIADRLLAFVQSVTDPGNLSSWSDPDRGLLLGYVIATPDGIYWRELIQDFARSLGVTVKPVGPPAPLPVTPQPPPVIVAPSGGGILLTDPPEITLRNTLNGQRFDIGIFLSRNDNGLRINRNWCLDMGYESFCDPYQPGTGISIEQDGAISFSGRQAFVNPVGRWDYPNTGKALDIQPAGFCNSPTYSFCEHFWVGSHSKGRGIELGTNDQNDPNIDARNGKIWISGSGSADPISIYVGGAKRKLIICPGTANQLCVQ